MRKTRGGDKMEMNSEEIGHAYWVENQLKREEENRLRGCPEGYHWISGFSRTTGTYGNAVWVKGHCAKNPYGSNHEIRDRTIKEGLSGQWEGEGKDPLDAVNSILREMHLPQDGRGDVEFFGDFGEPVREDEEPFQFLTNVYKDGKHYSVAGALIRRRVNSKGISRWKAGAEVEEE